MIEFVKDYEYRGRKWIYKNGKTLLRSHIVWEQYNGPIPKGFVIHHVNENKLDDRIENLQMLSSFNHKSLHAKKAHRSDAWRKMMSERNKGSRNGMAKAIGGLNPAARKIINLDTGEIFETVTSAARKYNVTPGNISAVCHGRRLKCVGFRWALA